MFSRSVLLALATSTISLAQVTNDFESGWDQTAWPTYAPDCTGGGNVTLDSTVAHSGKNSLKVSGGSGGYCGHEFFGTTKVPTGDVYIRSWVRPQTALNADHVTFIVMPDDTLGTGKHLRFGGMDSVMIYNRESDDATLPDLSPQGVATSVALPALTWSCLEQHLGTDGTIQTWLNGALVAGLSVGPGITNANANGWTKANYVPKIQGVYFGWEAYGGDVNTFWYDDIAIASTRVGCAAGTSTGTVSAAPKPSTTLATSASVAPATTTAVASATPAPSSCSSQMYGQCGGIGFTGCTSCASGSTCKVTNEYYSQCL